MESVKNFIIVIYDYGVGGYFNCFFELVEEIGGCIDFDVLFIGDFIFLVKEIFGNEF